MLYLGGNDDESFLSGKLSDFKSAFRGEVDRRDDIDDGDLILS